MAEEIQRLIGPGHDLHFYDAAAPLVGFESVDMEHAFFASRYDKGTPDYVNCPMNEEEYTAFHRELCTAQEAEVHGFEDRQVFEGCMPVEVMARRGVDTLRYGPLKPRGLRDPKTGREPYAVVQLRKDNAQGSVYNLVGFQTHLKFPEQKRVFSMIPALHTAAFLRYGVMHRNTYLALPAAAQSLLSAQKLPADLLCRSDDRCGRLCGSLRPQAFCAVWRLARRMAGLTPADFPAEGHRRPGALYGNRPVSGVSAYEHQLWLDSAAGPPGQREEK